MELKFYTKSQEETIALGMKIGPLLVKGDVITLDGDLGAGKTTFVTGVGKALGIKERMLSPTFNIMKCYFDAEIPLYHIDAYRLNEGNKDIGLEEFIEGNGVTLIEWPEFIKEMIPSSAIKITIRNLGDDNREILLSSLSDKFAALSKENN